MSAIWIENPKAVEESVNGLAAGAVRILAQNSIIPGDTFAINSSIFGTSNQGQFTVATITADTGTYTTLSVSQPLTTASATIGSATAAIYVTEGVPGRYIKRIKTIVPNATDPVNYVDVVMFDSAGAYTISASSGYTLTALDKLNFPIITNQGADGYARSAGLIAECNKIVYGLESDPATYPGIIASGSNLNIQGPIVKRVQVVLSIRVLTGYNQSILVERVKGVVAAAINRTPVGKSISLSDLISAATNIDGVTSVVFTTPASTVGTDLIAVQPFEKPMIVNINQDIIVNTIGI